MSSNKGTSKSTEETLFLMIKLGLTLVVIVLLVMHFSDTEIGCNRHNDNPYACIQDSNCRPDENYEDDEWKINCEDAVRTPNHDFNAAEDPDCFCPQGWNAVLNEEDEYYGMCREPTGEGYATCDYTLDPLPPTEDEYTPPAGCYDTDEEEVDSCQEWCEEELNMDCGGGECPLDSNAIYQVPRAEPGCQSMYEDSCNEEVEIGTGCTESILCSCVPPE